MKIRVFRNIAFAMIVAVVACSSSHSEEIKLTESLMKKLEQNESTLSLDIVLFTQRTEHIERVLASFKNTYTDTIGKELGDNLSRLNVLRKIYERNTGSYYENIKNQEELKKQLNNLKTDLKNGEISKKEFKAYYKTESEDIEELIIKSKELNKSYYELEPEYTRITEYLEPFKANIKQ